MVERLPCILWSIFPGLFGIFLGNPARSSCHVSLACFSATYRAYHRLRAGFFRHACCEAEGLAVRARGRVCVLRGEGGLRPEDQSSRRAAKEISRCIQRFWRQDCRVWKKQRGGRVVRKKLKSKVSIDMRGRSLELRGSRWRALKGEKET